MPKDRQQNNDRQGHAHKPKQHPTSKSHNDPPPLMSASKRRPAGGVPFPGTVIDVVGSALAGLSTKQVRHFLLQGFVDRFSLARLVIRSRRLRFDRPQW